MLENKSTAFFSLDRALLTAVILLLTFRGSHVKAIGEVKNDLLLDPTLTAFNTTCPVMGRSTSPALQSYVDDLVSRFLCGTFSEHR